MSDLPVVPADRSPDDDSLWATWELLRVAKFEEDIQPTISCGNAMELIESLVASREALAEANKEIKRLETELTEPLLKHLEVEGGNIDMMDDRRTEWQKDEWHHLAITWGDAVRIYMDGKLVAEKPRQGLVAGTTDRRILHRFR